MNRDDSAGVAEHRLGVVLVMARAARPCKIPAQRASEPRDGYVEDPRPRRWGVGSPLSKPNQAVTKRPGYSFLVRDYLSS
jgi:hypothetical protein